MFRYKLDRDVISRDLTDDRPLYILSAYGPGRDAPLQLFGGVQREQSFEELRTRHYELTAQGKQQAAVEEALTLVNNAEQQMKTALNDLDGAIRYICDGENQHPNRVDICRARGQLGDASGASSIPTPAFSQNSKASPFGQSAVLSAPGNRSGTTNFGQASTVSALNNPSAPAFGKPSAPASAFGQTSQSTFGTSSNTTFGQPSTPLSNLNNVSAPAFGQPAALGRPTTVFGQSSSGLGQPSFGASAFGQPSSQAPAFGAPSIQAPLFSQSSGQAPAFPQTQAPPLQSTGLEQSANLQSVGNFAASSESRVSNPFGLPSTTTVAQPSSRTNSSASVPFGHANQPSATASGNPATAAPGQFGQPSGQQRNPFGQPSSTGANTPFPTANAAVSRRSSVQLQSGTARQRDTQGKLTRFKGREVNYVDDVPYFKDDSRTEWQRIWFPDGPPAFTKMEDLPEAAYDAATKDNYRFAMEHRRFASGGIPLMPPRKDWCSWDL